MIIKAIEVCSKQTIKERERFWIAELNTSFPYGLNDRINTPPIQDAYGYTMNNTSTNNSIYETFNNSPSRRSKRGGTRNRRTHHRTTFNFDVAAFMDTVNSITPVNSYEFINSVRNHVMNLNKDNTKTLFLHLCTCINEHNHYFHTYSTNSYTSYLPYLVKDISFAKLKAMYIHKKRDTPKHFLILDFSNKLLDSINFNRILKHPDIVNLFPPVDDQSLRTPSISFRYSSTIRSKITNYRQTIEEGINPIHCDCREYDDAYKVHDHVFTGNLNIIDNLELRSLMKKGLNFREIPAANKNKVHTSIVNSIDSYICNTSTKTNIPVINFQPWKIELLAKIDNRLKQLDCYRYNNILNKPNNLNNLTQLQQKWVFTPTDKAANNITIVCKKHYMETLDNEIISSGNFNKSNLSHNDILDNQVNILKKYNLNTDRKMPFLYWTAKLHKDPYSHRFITSGRGSTMQPLSIHVGYCLKTILNIVRNDNRFHKRRTGINKCFVIDNRNPVTDYIKTCNQGNNVHSVSTFDFKTLYTSIPHNKLKQSLSTIIRSAFRSRKKKYIYVNGRRAVLCNEKKSSNTLSIQQLIDCVNHVIDQNFILYKGEVYRQCIGIPMGTNCAPYLANLFLHLYEHNFIDNLTKTQRTQLALTLANMFRYQDDCIIFNDDNNLLHNWRQIYPIEMILEKTNTGNSCTFLDLQITITDNNTFTYKSYDKRKDFNFDIINYPDLKSNIPRKPSYGVFTSQLVRYCDVNSQLDNFLRDIQLLATKLKKQHFDAASLQAQFCKFYSNNLWRWSKFGSDIVCATSLI